MIVQNSILVYSRTARQQGDKSIFTLLQRKTVFLGLNQSDSTAEPGPFIFIARCFAAPWTSIHIS